MRLIDADLLIEIIQNSNSAGGYMAPVVNAIYKYAINMVNAMPTVNPHRLDKSKLRNEIAPFIDEYGNIKMTITQFNIAVERSEEKQINQDLTKINQD